MSDTKPVTFTQFLRPHGTGKVVCIDRPSPIANKARELIRVGWAFEIEVLTTGEIHMTASTQLRNGEPLETGEICPNGPEVGAAVDRVVEEAYELAGRPF